MMEIFIVKWNTYDYSQVGNVTVRVDHCSYFSTRELADNFKSKLNSAGRLIRQDVYAYVDSSVLDPKHITPPTSGKDE